MWALTLCFGEVVNAVIIDESKDALTYLYYRQVKKGLSPKNAPTYIDKSKRTIKTDNQSDKKYNSPLAALFTMMRLKISNLSICMMTGCTRHVAPKRPILLKCSNSKK